VGEAVNLIFHYHGVDFSAFMGVGSLPMDNVIYFSASLSTALKAFFLGVLVSVLLSIAPAFRAARMQVIEAIRVAE
jgi:ABC-type antimicrobial peptide transport system permease subunit